MPVAFRDTYSIEAGEGDMRGLILSLVTVGRDQ